MSKITTWRTARMQRESVKRDSTFTCARPSRAWSIILFSAIFPLALIEYQVLVCSIPYESSTRAHHCYTAYPDMRYCPDTVWDTYLSLSRRKLSFVQTECRSFDDTSQDAYFCVVPSSLHLGTCEKMLCQNCIKFDSSRQYSWRAYK